MTIATISNESYLYTNAVLKYNVSSFYGRKGLPRRGPSPGGLEPEAREAQASVEKALVWGPNIYPEFCCCCLFVGVGGWSGEVLIDWLGTWRAE